jgi:ABC-2 type transport system permease protein
MHRFWAIFKKEFRQIRRDPLSLGLLVLVPALLLMLYGYALSFDVKNVPVAVLDEDGTAESRRFLERLFANAYFQRSAVLASSAEADRALARGTARAVVRVPRGFARSLARGEEAPVQVLVDGSDANTASIALGYLEAMAERANREWLAEALARAGAAGAPGPAVVPEPRLWFNPELRSGKFLVPGLIAMLLMISCVIATSLSLVREKERATLEQIRASPVRPEELLLGKTLPYVVVGLLTMALVLVLGRVLFGVAVQGSFLLLGVATLIFLFAALGQGLLISAATDSQLVAFQIAVLATLLPSLILSGLIFPLANMPRVIQAISYLVLPRYFVATLRGIILKATPLEALWPSLAAMLVLGLVFNAVAARKLRRGA